MSISRLTTFLLLGFSLAFSVNAADEADASALENGKQVYDVWCIICHGEDDQFSGGGTAALQVLYRGAVPAKLEDRTDMSAELITLLVRQGRFGMPNFRLTEISEQELADLITYLQRNNAASAN